jgi:hypothetical protein
MTERRFLQILTILLLMHAAPVFFLFRSWYGWRFTLYLTAAALTGFVVFPLLDGFLEASAPDAWRAMTRVYRPMTFAYAIGWLLPIAGAQIAFAAFLRLTTHRPPTGSTGQFHIPVDYPLVMTLDKVLPALLLAGLYFYPHDGFSERDVLALLPVLAAYYIVLAISAETGAVPWLDDGEAAPLPRAPRIRKVQTARRAAGAGGLRHIFARRDPAMQQLMTHDKPSDQGRS